jgi:exonuclease SbcD
LFINNRLEELKKADVSVWVEILYESDEIFSDLTAWASERVVGTKIEIIKLQNKQYLNEVLTQDDSAQALEELDPFEVFDKLLEKNNISTEQQAELRGLYKEITAELNNIYNDCL